MKTNPGKIVIFGQYKTGTTGLFTKINNSLPAGTKTLFEPLVYTAEDSDKRRWVLAKVILKEPGHPEPVDYESFLGFNRRICISRDPRDWLVSATLFNCQLKQSIYGDVKAMEWVMDYLHRKEESPHGRPLKSLLDYILSAPPALDIEAFAKRSQKRHAFCIDFHTSLKQNVLPVRYEDFVDGHVRAIEEYLEMPLDGRSQVDTAYAHVPRTCSYGNWRDWFTEEDVEFFSPFFDEYIRHYGYDRDWVLKDHPVIMPAHCSLYVSRVVQLRRGSVDASAHEG